MEELYLASTWRRLSAFALDLVFAAVLGLTGWYLTGQWFVVALLSYGYFVLSYRLLSRTLGKKLLGLYVMGYDGRRKLSWTRCFIRGAVQLLSPILSLIPQILALFREDRKQLADLLAGTQVMQKRPRMRPPRIRRRIAVTWIFIFLSLTTFLLYRYLP